MWKHPAYSGVTRFVICDSPLLIGSDNLALSLKTAHYSVDGIEEVLLVDGRLIFTCCDKGSLITYVRDVRAREAWSMLCEEFEIEIICKLEVSEVYLEDLHSLLEVRKLYATSTTWKDY